MLEAPVDDRELLVDGFEEAPVLTEQIVEAGCDLLLDRMYQSLEMLESAVKRRLGRRSSASSRRVRSRMASSWPNRAGAPRLPGQLSGDDRDHELGVRQLGEAFVQK